MVKRHRVMTPAQHRTFIQMGTRIRTLERDADPSVTGLTN